jgi:acyl transferase domain-containing protein
MSEEKRLNMSPDELSAQGIAIIGMAGRFPGANTLQQFWENLRDGRECVTDFSEAEMEAAGVGSSLYKLPNYVKSGAVLDDIDMFDALFFGYSARDAEITDPQQRLFLECAWQCIENAGYNAEAYPGLIGVFGGLDWSTYLYQIYANADKLGYIDGFQLNVGNDKDHLATQTSYKLNLRGPSLTVQTACSTSLTAVCIACQSLLSYNCDMALAGGAAIAIPQRRGYYYMPGSILSPDGHCRAFDAAAQGTIIGNGVGVVMLKRLAEAIADRDHIYAVILGYSLNNDGSAKVGYTAPSVEGQAQAIAMAQAMAGVDPETIDYIEAHGTATILGDPIEVAALTSVFRAKTTKKNYCGIGSLKSNVGHLASAAGVAGLIKTVLSLTHRQIAPSLHFRKPNPGIDFANSPFYVNTTLKDWSDNGHRRRAAVSSFGVGGTNAHVVLEEAPEETVVSPSRPLDLIVLSAKTATALEKTTDNAARHLREHPDLDLADVAYTYQVGRKGFSYRRALVCHTADAGDAAAALESRDPQRTITTFSESRDRAIFFMFSGQGTQYPSMLKDLYESEPTFRRCVDGCSAILMQQSGVDLRAFIYPDGDSNDAADRLRDTAVTQPALFVVEYALAALWMEWGIVPAAMAGHSIGEYVAACLAGVFSLEDALQLVRLRGQLMARMPAGAMLALSMSESEVQPLLGGDVSLAAVNGPTLCVLSGPIAVMDRVAQDLTARNVQCRRLQTSHAFHSSMMDPVVEEFIDHVRTVQLAPPNIPVLSNVTGNWMTAENATSPAYWGTHLRQTVRFSECIARLLSKGEWVLLEVGPGNTLCTLSRHQPPCGPGTIVLPSARAPHQNEHDLAVMLNSLAQLWAAGVQINWSGFRVHEKRRRVELPTYPFERERYWIGSPDRVQAKTATADAGPRNVGEWFFEPIWKPAIPSKHARSGENRAARTSWLLFRDEGGLGQRLEERLSRNGMTVISAIPGSAFTRLSPSCFTIRPSELRDYEALIKATGIRAPLTVAHFWNVSTDEPSPLSREAFARSQETGFFSLVALTQALGKINFSEPVPIGVFSTHLQVVLGEEHIDPAKATLSGPCKVAPQEYPQLRLRSIDLSFDTPGSEDKLIERIIAELTVEPFAATVAYRGGRRWIQSFERADIPAVTTNPQHIREEGVYLITGGLGNIGLTLAESLAVNFRARLVLVGRSPVPPREQWQERIENNPSADLSRKLRKLIEFEQAGAQILVCSADSSDLEAMRVVFEQATQRFGTIHGVIHGAGNVTTGAFGAIKDTTRQLAFAQFAPKVDGLLVLDQLCANRDLDFCLLLSSLSAVLGGLGLCAYSSANLFMDAYAARENQADCFPWISVNWDSWHFADTPAGGPPPEAILPAEGAECFRRIVERQPRQAVVAVSELKARFDKWINLQTVHPATSQENRSSTAAMASHKRPNLSSQYVAARTETERKTVQVWEQLLGVSPVGIYDKFFELGGHSLLAIQLTSRLRETFEIELPIQRVFEFPTVAQLAESIDRDVAAAQQALTQPDEETLAELLELVENMSAEEIAALINDEDDVKRKVHHG